MIVGIKLEWLALVFSTLLRQGDIETLLFWPFLFFFSFLFFAFIFLKGFSVCYGLSSKMAAHIFGPLQTNCLFKRLKNTTIFIARLQCYNNKSLQKFLGIFFFFVFRRYWRTAHTRRTFFGIFTILKKSEDTLNISN